MPLPLLILPGYRYCLGLVFLSKSCCDDTHCLPWICWIVVNASVEGHVFAAWPDVSWMTCCLGGSSRNRLACTLLCKRNRTEVSCTRLRSVTEHTTSALFVSVCMLLSPFFVACSAA